MVKTTRLNHKVVFIRRTSMPSMGLICNRTTKLPLIKKKSQKTRLTQNQDITKRMHLLSMVINMLKLRVKEVCSSATQLSSMAMKFLLTERDPTKLIRKQIRHSKKRSLQAILTNKDLRNMRIIPLETPTTKRT